MRGKYREKALSAGVCGLEEILGVWGEVDYRAKTASLLRLRRSREMMREFLGALELALSQSIGAAVSFSQPLMDQIAAAETESGGALLEFKVFRQHLFILLPKQGVEILSNAPFSSREASGCGGDFPEYLNWLSAEAAQNTELIARHCTYLQSIEILSTTNVLKQRATQLHEAVEQGKYAVLLLLVELLGRGFPVQVYLEKELCERIAQHARTRNCSEAGREALRRRKVEKKLVLEWRLNSLSPLFTLLPGQRVSLSAPGRGLGKPSWSLEESTWCAAGESSSDIEKSSESLPLEFVAVQSDEILVLKVRGDYERKLHTA